MKNIYPKTIFVDENGEMMPNEYDKEKYKIKKQWYERRIEPGDRITEAKTINQRYVILEETKNKQLKIAF